MDKFKFKCFSRPESTLALFFLQGFDVTWCKNPDRGLPCPDIVFYLEISVKDAMLRASFGDERYENLEFQQHVAEVYHRLKSDDWKVSHVVFTSVLSLLLKGYIFSCLNHNIFLNVYLTLVIDETTYRSIVSPKRNWKQCLCKIWRDKQRVLWHFPKWPITKVIICVFK